MLGDAMRTGALPVGRQRSSDEKVTGGLIMASKRQRKGLVTRRQVVKAAGAVGVAASVGPFVITRPARAA
ncbi:MAG: twin-arginine translocation signal domain-containing protein, partial [Alphaproteobacteria bacterium]